MFRSSPCALVSAYNYIDSSNCECSMTGLCHFDKVLQHHSKNQYENRIKETRISIDVGTPKFSLKKVVQFGAF